MPQGSRLFRIEFHDELFLNGKGDLIARRQLVYDSLKCRLIELQPSWDAALFNRFESSFDRFKRATSFTDFDHIASLDKIRGNIDFTIVHEHMPVADEL